MDDTHAEGTTAGTASDEAATAALDALATQLAGRAWIARSDILPGRLASIYVQNPEPGAAALAEHIYCGRACDGTWHYWWSWAERIAPADDPVTAADRITHVLRATTLNRG